MAKQVVGRLSAILSLHTTTFKKSLKTARADLMRFAKSMARISIAVVKLGAALAGAAVTGLAVMTRRTLKSIDATAKWADRLGIATEELTKLQHAAALSGVQADTLNMALQRSTRRISEAAAGTGEAVDALKELGLNAQHLNKLAPDEQFREIAGAMSQVEKQSDRVRLAFKLFDSEGVALVNTLKLGKEGLDAAGKEAEALGVTLTREQTAKAEAANNAMFRLWQTVKGAAQTFAILVAPVITDIGNRIATWAAETGALRKASKWTFDTMVKGIAWVLDASDSLNRVWLGVKITIMDAAAAIVEMVGKLDLALGKIPGIKSTFSREQYDAWSQGLRGASGEAVQQLAKYETGPSTGAMFRDYVKDLSVTAEQPGGESEVVAELKKLNMNIKTVTTIG